MLESIFTVLHSNLEENYHLIITSSFLATISTFLYSHISGDDEAHTLKGYKAVLECIPKRKFSVFLELFFFEYKKCDQVLRGKWYQFRARISRPYLSYKLFSGGLQYILLVILLINVSNVLITVIYVKVWNYILLILVLIIFVLAYLFCLYIKLFLCKRIGEIFDKTIQKFEGTLGKRELKLKNKIIGAEAMYLPPNDITTILKKDIIPVLGEIKDKISKSRKKKNRP